MKMIRIFSLFYVFFMYQILQSCQKEPVISEPVIKEFFNVDQRLWPHFEEFEQEASDRGYRLDLNQLNLMGSLDDIEERGVIGTCSYGFRNPRDVTIDFPYWQNVGHLAREELVFHELGHCILSRSHTEATTNNGFCASIMRSGTGNCRLPYTSQNREFYLDELFEITGP